MIVVREIQAGEETRWDEYIRNSPDSTPQNLYAWKLVMEEVFHSETHYLMAEEAGSIRGVLPLIHVNSLLAGHYVTSQPGGICADDPDTAKALLHYARGYVIDHKAKYLILRDSRKKWDFPDCVTNEDHITFVNKIPAELDQLKSSLKKKTRWRINQASNNGLTAEIGLKNLEGYYPIYARAMHELGTPTLGLDFFRHAVAHFPKETELITLYYNDQVVGGGFIAPFKDTIYCLWSGLLHKHYALHTAYRSSWEAMKYAQENGFHWLDLGRCKKGSGGQTFKEQFGGELTQLYQQIYLNGIDRAPNVGAERAEEIKYRAFVKLWRILPLWMTDKLGPILRRQVPFG
jgi:FemAB-related protein (PEP-CTERM system-associated)